MGASTSRYHSFSEPLETRQLLSAVPIQSVSIAPRMPIPSEAIFIGPVFQFGGGAPIQADFQANIAAIPWSHAFAAPPISSGGPQATGSMTVAVIAVSDTDSPASLYSTEMSAPPATSAGSIAQANVADREPFQTITASLTIDGGSADTGLPDGSSSDGTSDGTDSSTLAASNQTSAAGTATPVAVTRSAGNGGHAQPGLLHPGPNENREGGSSGADGESGDGSGANGSRGHSGEASPSTASVIVSETHVGTADSDLSSTSSQTSVVSVPSAAGKPSSGMSGSVLSGVDLVVKPLTSATFSILPLAIAEMSVPLTSVDLTGAPATPMAFAQAAVKRAAAFIDAVNTAIVMPAAPARAALINLFHVDALSTFRDAMGAFIDESAMRVASHRPTSHSRAWKITAGAAAADLLLVGYWLAMRRQEESADEPDPSRSEQGGTKPECFPFCGTSLSPH
jgi:hypothetical protein